MSSQTPLPIVVGMALAMVSSSLRAQSVADHTRLFSAGPTVTGMAAAVNDQQVESEPVNDNGTLYGIN